MATHDLHDESALVRVSRAGYSIDCLDDPVERWVRTNGHVCSTEVVVNGTDLQLLVNSQLHNKKKWGSPKKRMIIE